MSLVKIDGKFQIKDQSIDVTKLDSNFLFGSNWKLNADQVVNKYTITSVPNPINSDDIANKQYVDYFINTKPRYITNITCNNPGSSGKLSFGLANHIDGVNNAPENINDIFLISNDRLGIVTSSLHFQVFPTEVLLKGSLIVYLNNVELFNLDMSLIDDPDLLSPNGSALSFSHIQYIKSSDNQDIESLQYRECSLIIDISDMLPGFNELYISHDNNNTNKLSWVYDNSTDQVISDFKITNLFGKLKYLSGVKYYTDLYINVLVYIKKLFNITFSSNDNAIDYVSDHIKETSDPLPDINSHLDDLNIEKSLFVSADRLLNESVSVLVNIYRPSKSTIESQILKINNILSDQVISNSTDYFEDFNDEVYRLSDDYIEWNSIESIQLKPALQVFNSTLIYPKLNFSNLENGPIDNVDYSNLTGNRFYLRKIKPQLDKCNFNLKLTCLNCDFVPVDVVLSDNKLHLEIGILIDNYYNWKDLCIDYNGDPNGIGCKADIFGSDIPLDWGGTFGILTSSDSLVLRISASSNWIGSIDRLQFGWI